MSIRTAEDVKKAFDTEVDRAAFRCTLCRSMQPRGSVRVWVNSSSGYFPNESYESLVNGAHESSRSAACMPCVLNRK